MSKMDMATDFEKEFHPISEEPYHNDDDDDDDDMDNADPSERVDPNKFENLCDGVVGSLALVHENCKEFMDFKDELLLHSLPPNVLLKMGLMSGKVFRSISDLHQPLNELVRLVRVYSTPWEEKSQALQKLHESYEKKQRQLNIAIHRLAMVEENRKRMEKTERLLNWEKLFARVMTSKGHGRRWKFRMKDFKVVAKQGYDAVQAYVDSLDEENAGFKEVEEIDEPEEEQVDEPEPEVGQEDDRPSSTPDLDATTVTLVAAEKPEMRDRGLWTHEPEYDRCLRARVFRPTGLNKEWVDMKCKLTYGQVAYKTKSLDPLLEMAELAPKDNEEDRKPSRGLIGMRGRGRGGKAGQQRKEKKKDAPPVFEDCEFQVADEIAGGSHHTTVHQEILRVSVHHGGREQMVAIATIELEDLEAIDLPILFEDPPPGDDLPPESEVDRPPPLDGATDIDCNLTETDVQSVNDLQPPDVAVSEERSQSKLSREEEAKLKEVEPLNFPLYSIFGGKADAQTPCGQLPLVFFWVKRLRPKTHNRFAATSTFNELVMDVTGIDLRTFTKGELEQPKPVIETESRACSVIDLTEESVPKKDYDAMVAQNDENMNQLKQEYQEQMAVMAQSMINLQDQLLQAEFEQQAEPSRSTRSPAKSVKSVQMDGRITSSKSSVGSLGNPSRPGSKQSPLKTPSQHSFVGEASHDQQLVPSRVSLVSREGGSPQLAPLEEPPAGSLAVPTPAGDSPGVTFHYPVAAVMESREVKTRTQPPPGGSVGTFKDGGVKSFVQSRQIPNWGDGVDGNFQERMRIYAANRARHLEEMEESRTREVSQDIERRLASEFKLSRGGGDDIVTALNDVNLPALFMPTRSSTGIYNPRAHQYFHPGGSSAVRISQPPSMVTLPPLPKHKVSVLNMFDISNNFTRGPDYLLQRFFAQQEIHREELEVDAPAPTMDVLRQSSQQDTDLS